jgi:hypothetical protein
MKKLITLLLLFTITLFYSIPTQAYTINDLDVEIAQLNNLTLRELFIDNQLIENGDFNDGLTNFTRARADGSVSNSIYSFTATLQFGRIIEILPTFTSANSYYAVAKVKSSSNLVSLSRNSNSGTGNFGFHSGSNLFETLSGIWIPLSTTDNLSVKDSRTIGFDTVEVDFLYAYDLTDLGLTSLTISVLNYWFNEFERINIFIEGYNEGILASEAYANGFTAGYEVGYGDGYQDAVEEDNAYALGFAKGLLEGTDMETGSSLLILIVALIGFVMMIFGFTTKRGIFNLLSVGAFVVLGTLLVQFVGFVIIAIGLVLINIYYAFFGDL